MPIVSIIIIAVALAMDAFAVSISSGFAISRMRVRHALVIASFFGVFQGLMPFIGWHAGQEIKGLLASWDHWVAFLLLFAVGFKMIYDAFRERENARRHDPLNIYVLFVLSIATSIDALAAGMTLSFVNLSIVFPVLIIGMVTFAMSLIGTYVGTRYGHLLEKKVEIVAGLLLIGIGIKILIQHSLH